jgi:hypothetical protein
MKKPRTGGSGASKFLLGTGDGGNHHCLKRTPSRRPPQPLLALPFVHN